MNTKINWKVRLKNPTFYINTSMVFLFSILSYMGLTAESITSWSALFDVIKSALSNPYCLLITITGVYNVIIDSSSKGIGDDEPTLEKKKA